MGTAGIRTTIGWLAVNDSFMPEWAKLMRNACDAWYKAKIDEINPADDPSGIIRHNVFYNSEVQGVHHSLLEMERWWATESLSSPSVDTFLYVLAHWLSQDPNSPEITTQSLQNTLFMFQSRCGNISYTLNDLLMKYIATDAKNN